MTNCLTFVYDGLPGEASEESPYNPLHTPGSTRSERPGKLRSGFLEFYGFERSETFRFQLEGKMPSGGRA